MADFVTADQHFGHGKVMEYEGRPFTSVVAMDNAMIDRWNRVVKDGDTVYCLGDFSFYGLQETQAIMGWLKGRKILIMGNHDCGHSVSWWFDAGFEAVYYGLLLPFHRQRLWLTHCPKPYKQSWNVHGHSHGKLPFYDSDLGSFCVSVENTDYAPVPMEKLWHYMQTSGKDKLELLQGLNSHEVPGFTGERDVAFDVS